MDRARKHETTMKATLVISILLGLLLGGCAEDRFSSLDLFSPVPPPTPRATVTVVVPNDISTIIGDGVLERRLRNAAGLAAKKRFPEAERELALVSGSLPPRSNLWMAVKCAEMTTALRANDLNRFLGAAAAVERQLDDPLHPPAGCVDQIAIARTLMGQPLPIGVPDGLMKTID